MNQERSQNRYRLALLLSAVLLGAALLAQGQGQSSDQDPGQGSVRRTLPERVLEEEDVVEGHGIGWTRGYSLSELIEVSHLVVEGRVVKATPKLTDDQERIMTHLTLRVTDVLVGDMPEETMTISIWGGELLLPGGRARYLSSSTGRAKPAVGAKYVFFLLYEPTVDYEWILSRSAQSLFEVSGTEIIPHIMGLDYPVLEFKGADSSVFKDRIRGGG